METKNVLLAISLSILVIVLYSFFFAPPPPDLSKQKNNITNTTNSTEDTNISSPSIEKKSESKNISRSEALNLNDRVKIENRNIVGSISLKGAIIDDLTFKNYTTELNSDKKVTLLNPQSIKPSENSSNSLSPS